MSEPNNSFLSTFSEIDNLDLMEPNHPTERQRMESAIARLVIGSRNSREVMDALMLEMIRISHNETSSDREKLFGLQAAILVSTENARGQLSYAERGVEEFAQQTSGLHPALRRQFPPIISFPTITVNQHDSTKEVVERLERVITRLMHRIRVSQQSDSDDEESDRILNALSLDYLGAPQPQQPPHEQSLVPRCPIRQLALAFQYPIHTQVLAPQQPIPEQAHAPQQFGYQQAYGLQFASPNTPVAPPYAQYSQTPVVQRVYPQVPQPQQQSQQGRNSSQSTVQYFPVNNWQLQEGSSNTNQQRGNYGGNGYNRRD